MVGASSALILAYGIGAAAGPTLTALTMQMLGPAGYPLFQAVLHNAIGLFALYRMTRRAPAPAEERGTYMTVADAVAGGDLAGPGGGAHANRLDGGTDGYRFSRCTLRKGPALRRFALAPGLVRRYSSRVDEHRSGTTP